MSQVVYQVRSAELRTLLKQVAEACDAILAAAPVDGSGKYLDDGTWSTEDVALGIPVRVVHVDVNSLRSLESSVSFAICDIVDEPALNLTDGWYVTHYTLSRVARLIDQLNEIHTRVRAIVPGLDVETPQGLGGVVGGAAVVPASLRDFSTGEWPDPELVYALRSLADLNYASHRAEHHGKSWEPGFQIVKSCDQWTITFLSYQFDDPYREDDKYVFTGTWGEVTDQIRAATDSFARKYEVQRDGAGLDEDHPLARLSASELASLPDGVQIHLRPGFVCVRNGPQRDLLERIDVGPDVGALIEFARYVVTVAPEHDSIGNVIGWTGERHPPAEEYGSSD